MVGLFNTAAQMYVYSLAFDPFYIISGASARNEMHFHEQPGEKNVLNSTALHWAGGWSTSKYEGYLKGKLNPKNFAGYQQPDLSLHMSKARPCSTMFSFICHRSFRR